jgi:hypothetical protein
MIMPVRRRPVSVELSAFSKAMLAGIAIHRINVLDAGWTRHMPEGAEQQ